MSSNSHLSPITMAVMTIYQLPTMRQVLFVNGLVEFSQQLWEADGIPAVLNMKRRGGKESM